MKRLRRLGRILVRLWHIWRHELTPGEREWQYYIIGFPAVLCILCALTITYRLTQ